MARSRSVSTVVTLRVTPELNRLLTREARRRRKTRSTVAREILQGQLTGIEPDHAAEARRQSLLVSRRRSERDALAFVERAADTTGWK